MKKILILFALREIKDIINDIYYETLNKFINCTIKSYNLNFEIECLIIHNSSIEYNLNLPNNFKLITQKNYGHGWGGWKIGLDLVNINNYDYFCLIKDKTTLFTNSSNYKINWIENCVNLLINNVIMIGHTINSTAKFNNNYTFNKPHCQAQFLFLNKIALDIMFKHNLFSSSIKGKREKQISRFILNKGYNINCLEFTNSNINYIKLKKLKIPYEKALEFKKLLTENTTIIQILKIYNII